MHCNNESGKMTNNSLNISIPLKFEIKTPPRGMTDYDPKALSADQQKELNGHKLCVRKENVLFLSQHHEITALVSMIVRLAFIQRPRNIIEFVANVFTRPEREIREEVEKILNESPLEYEDIPYSDYEPWDY